MDFLDLDVLVESRGQDRVVRIVDSPAGQTAPEPFVAPFTELELENFVLRVGRPRTARRALRLPGASDTALDEAKVVGDRLLRALFPSGSAMACLLTSVAQARAGDVGLRIRLHLRDAPDLARYPWEFVYDANVDRFLCLSSHTPVVRYLDVPEPPSPLPVASPLRILVVISSPSDATPLGVEREWSNLTTAMADVVARGLVHIERLPTATMPALARHLRGGAYHVLHFIGHGAFDTRAGDGVLAFEDAEGRTRLVGADELGAHLHDHRSMGLALLNSCEGARSDTADPFSGTAQSLIRHGLGAVVAMQFEVTDEAAIAFSQTFYESLAVGYPVDAAVAEGRKAVLSLPNPLEWATPVLYLRAPHGRIFDVAVRPTEPIAPRDDLPDDMQPTVETVSSVPWWRRRIALGAAAAAVVVLIALTIALSDGDGDGGDGSEVAGGEVVRETVTVRGDAAWTDTGIDVSEGDYIDIVASGSVVHDSSNPLAAVGPDGAGEEAAPPLNTPGEGVYLYPPGHGGLIARYGDGAPVFGIGDQWADNASRSGRLQLGINDYNSGNVDAAVANNTGAFTVRITVTRNT